MTQDTKDFCVNGAPFRVAPSSAQWMALDWVVRSKIGEGVAFCVDEEAANAIAEALNEGVK